TMDEIRVRRNTLGDVFRRSARRDPSRVAVIYHNQALTYMEWNALVNRWAHGMAGYGIGPGDRVAVVGGNSLALASMAGALAKNGAVMVPINPSLTEEEMAYILHHAEISAVAADAGVASRVNDALGDSPVKCRVILEGSAKGGWESVQGFDSMPSTEFWGSVADDDIAQILYTSGTESKPKGVMLTHRNVVDQCISIIFAGEFRSEDTVLHALPFFHSAQLNAFLWPFIYVGGTHVILNRPDPVHVLQMIETHQVRVFFAPPTVWIGILRSPSFHPDRLRSLQTAIYGAAIMPLEILQELHEGMPWVRFYNMYGMTEVAPFATGLRPQDQLTHPGSVGKPGINVEMTILRDDGSEAEAGEAGEIGLRTSHAFLGYFRDPERTAEAFRGGWYHTGDIGVIDAEGYLTVVDRKKDMIKTGGENVSSREVEDVFYRHPAILECAAIGLPDPYWMEKVVLVAVLRPGSTVTESELIAWGREHLAGFKAPKQIVVRDHLPKNAGGKILKRTIKAELTRA
ncbi:MAG: AMP-binding protein, partial [Sulfobacillus sp.]|nr:AMP-binding protein [Sulfobacillus sp.]